MVMTQPISVQAKSIGAPRKRKSIFRHLRKMSKGEIVFTVVNIVVLVIIGLLALYPFLYTLTISLSTAAEANKSGGLVGLHLYPHKVCFDAYKLVLQTPEILTGLWNSLLRTVVGTVVTVFLTCLCAYPLAFRDLPHRKLFIFLTIFTMIFSGGVFPAYMLVRDLGMINTLWALVLPGALSAFNIIVMKNFFQQLPPSLREAASMDGASEWTILFRIYFPLSTAVIATITLWTAVGHWNSWFDAMLYITDDHKQVLTMLLQRITQGNQTMLQAGIKDQALYTPQTIKAATTIVTILPIIALYPFVQKYFMKGILLGGIKE
jgi:putative aldouronate transport system permease protein